MSSVSLTSTSPVKVRDEINVCIQSLNELVVGTPLLCPSTELKNIVEKLKSVSKRLDALLVTLDEREASSKFVYDSVNSASKQCVDIYRRVLHFYYCIDGIYKVNVNHSLSFIGLKGWDSIPMIIADLKELPE